jgi:hypothetical protein
LRVTQLLSSTLLQTGKGYADAPMAVLHAPEGASPGSLAALTWFLLEKHVRCLPGYTGTQQAPVLRLSSYGDDAALVRLLKEEFPRWQEAQGIPAEQRVEVAPDLQPTPLDTSATKQQRAKMEGFFARHSNFIPAACYFVGDAGVLFSAFRDRKPLKMATAVAYTSGVINMLVFGGKADTPRTAQEMMKTIDPLFRDGAGAEAASQMSHHTFAFMQRYPWEVSGVLNMLGGGTQTLAAIGRLFSSTNASRNVMKQYLEIFAGSAMMAGQAVQTFVPEKGTDAFLNLGESLEARRQSLAVLDYHQLAQEVVKYARGDYHTWSEWVKEKPMRVTGGVNLSSNLALGAAGLAESARSGKYDRGNIVASLSYMTGNVLQAKTSKVKGPSFDDIVTAAADRLQAEPSSTEPMAKRIRRVSHGLVGMPESRTAPEKLEAAIRQRLEEKGSLASHFIGAEAQVLRRSPFLSPQLLHQMAAASPVPER